MVCNLVYQSPTTQFIVVVLVPYYLLVGLAHYFVSNQTHKNRSLFWFLYALWLVLVVFKYVAQHYTCEVIRRKHATVYLLCLIFGAVPAFIVAILNPILLLTLDKFQERHDRMFMLYYMVLIPQIFLDSILLLLTVCVTASRDITYKPRDKVNLKRLTNNKYLQSIDKNDVCWNYVEMLVDKTWIYDVQIGRDATALSHRNIKVKQVYRICNETLDYKGGSESPKVGLEDADIQGSSVQPNEGSHAPHSNKDSQAPCPNDNALFKDNENQSAMQHDKSESVRISTDLKSNSDTGPQRTILDSILTRKLVNEHHQVKLTECNIHESKHMGDNEVYLFHGTQHKNARKIIKNGFDITKIKRTPYGKGIYLTESSQKADQYTGE